MQPATAPPIGLDAAVAAAVRSALDATNAQHPATDRLANSIHEAERRSGLSRSTLYRLMDAGQLAYVKVGARRLIPEADLRALVAGDSSAAA